MIFSILSILLIISLGYFVIDLFDKENHPFNSLEIKLPTSVAIGFGLFSSLYFLWIFLTNTKEYFSIFFTTALISTFVFWIKQKKNFLTKKADDTPNKQTKIHFALKLTFFISLLFALLYFIDIAINIPYGEIDATGIWNYKARYIFRAEHWQDLFSSSTAHKDYPLLLPSLIAGIYTLTGKETLWVPILVAFAYTFSVPFLLYGSLKLIKSKLNAVFFTTLFFMIPFFIMRGSMQIADVPLSLYILLALVMITQKEKLFNHKYSLVLAGCSTGFAIWTKNEGLLFLVILLYTYAFRLWLKEKKSLKYFICGLIPAMSAYFLFKFNFPYRNDLFSQIGLSQMLSQIFDVARHKYILANYFSLIKTHLFFASPFIPLLILIMIKQGFKTIKIKHYTELIIIPILMLIGYYCIYLISYVPLEFHIKTSLGRLFIHVLPAIIFFIGVSVDFSSVSEYFLTKKRTD